MHARIELHHAHAAGEEVRVEKTRVRERSSRFQDDVSRAYRVWLNLRPASEIADAPPLEKLLAKGKPAESQTVKILARLYLDCDPACDDARRVLAAGERPLVPRREGDLGSCVCKRPRKMSQRRGTPVPALHGQAISDGARAMPSPFGAVWCVRREEFARKHARILTPLVKSCVRGGQA